MQDFYHKVPCSVWGSRFVITFPIDVIQRAVYNTSLFVHSARFDCDGNELSLLDCKLSKSYCSQYWAGYVSCRG